MQERKPYIEVDSAKRTLYHIYDFLEYAHAEISVGVDGKINSDCTVNDVIKIQSAISDKLYETMELLVDLISAHSEPVKTNELRGFMIGDRVKIIELCSEDIEDTNLKHGALGTIVGIVNGDSAVFEVDFGKELKVVRYARNLTSDGYHMFARQLELVEDET